MLMVRAGSGRTRVDVTIESPRGPHGGALVGGAGDRRALALCPMGHAKPAER